MKRAKVLIITLSLLMLSIICISDMNPMGDVLASSVLPSATPKNKLQLGVDGTGNIKVALAPGSNTLGMKFGYIEDVEKLFTPSDDDTLALLKGKDMELSLSASLISDLFSPTVDVMGISKEVNNTDIGGEVPTIINYVDVGIYKQISGEADSKVRIDETNVPVNVVMPTPQVATELLDGYRRNYFLFSFVDGSLSTIGPFYEDNGNVNMQLQNFGSFALTYVDLPIPVNATVQAPVYKPANMPATSPETIKEKINSMTTITPVAQSSFTAADVERLTNTTQEYNVDETKYADQNTTNTTGGALSIPFSKALGALLIFDLLLVTCAVSFFFIHRAQKVSDR